MRIIPGNTKVQIEIFKGVSLWDLLAGAIAAIMLTLILISTLPFKLVFAVVHLFFSILLLSRLDKESNYMYLISILRHIGYGTYFNRLDDDETLKDIAKRGANEVAIDEIFQKREEQNAKGELKAELETKEERKMRLKREKEEYKRDEKLLKSKKLTKEEEDAIWLKRANQSQAKKSAKKAEARRKKKIKYEDIEKITPYTNIKDGYIEYANKYYGVALQIPDIELKFFSQSRRTNSIENGLGSILRGMREDYCANIVKIERPISYGEHLALERRKLEELRVSYESGFIKEDELKSRVSIVYDRIYELQDLDKNVQVVVPFYYLVLFDSDKKQLNSFVETALESLRNGEMYAHRLNDKELAVFLKYTNEIDFDERDVNKIRPEDYAKWATPKTLHFTPRTAVINGMVSHNFRIVSYPTSVLDAWIASLMTYPSTKVMIKMKKMDTGKAITAIDKSLSELRAKVNEAKSDSVALEAQTHLETLQMLLQQLQGDNEVLLNCNFYITAYDPLFTDENPKFDSLEYSTLRARMSNMKKNIRRTWSEDGFRLNNNEFSQALAYIGNQVSGYDPLAKKGRGIPSNTVAACFPWVFPFVMDTEGIKLGASDGVPVFVDFFKRDGERVNSNMVIVGKSGSGKSYATKALLANLAADDAKIFILDPEDEYTDLAKNLNGKFINVANAQYGRLNPFHVITTLDDDESDGQTAASSYSTHLQFLEEFFKQILPDCDRDSLEYLNALVDRVYANKGITPDSDFSRLKPEDYPIFDDLYDEILKEFQRTDSDYIRTMLRTLMNYISKFSEGGRNAVIWNGPSSITTEENFTVFNFQSLLANRNTTVANAQMLLVLKYIDNEIIKNRDYNEKYGLHRKVVVVIDEAHVFIDTKYPVALDFMFQLAKRIRKYNGMQIVITQNIKDFVGSEEIARKSTAIINACQYSFIFALAPNDMDDLCKLYSKAGGINENEQEQIVQAQRGQAFVVMSPTSRTSFKIQVPDGVRDLFSNPNYVNQYFDLKGGDKYWADYVKDSPEKRAENLAARGIVEIQEEEQEIPKIRPITLDEISEDEFNETYNKPIEVEIEEVPEVSEEMDLGAQLAASALAAAAAVPPVPAEPAAPTKTEELLAELALKLGSDNMLEQIKRTVKEELEKELGQRPAPVAATYDVDAAPSFNPADLITPPAMQLESEVLPSAGEEPEMLDQTAQTEDEDDDLDLDLSAMLGLGEAGDGSYDPALENIFGIEDPMEDAESSESKDSDAPVALGSIFDFAKLAMDDETAYDISDSIELDSYDEDTEDDANSSDDDGFDVMAFLAQQAGEAENTAPIDTAIEDFINGTETLLEVSLDQLMSYNKQHR